MHKDATQREIDTHENKITQLESEIQMAQQRKQTDEQAALHEVEKREQVAVDESEITSWRSKYELEQANDHSIPKLEAELTQARQQLEVSKKALEDALQKEKEEHEVRQRVDRMRAFSNDQQH